MWGIIFTTIWHPWMISSMLWSEEIVFHFSKNSTSLKWHCLCYTEIISWTHLRHFTSTFGLSPPPFSSDIMDRSCGCFAISGDASGISTYTSGSFLNSKVYENHCRLNNLAAFVYHLGLSNCCSSCLLFCFLSRCFSHFAALGLCDILVCRSLSIGNFPFFGANFWV